jgi:hypothetical protein
MNAFVQPGGYAVMRLYGLSGDDAFIDKSYLHFSGFADNRNSTWDAELCRQFDAEIEKMPPGFLKTSTILPSSGQKQARRQSLTRKK